MYVARVPNRNSPPAILLRESYREGGKVKNRTLANLSHWPEEKILALQGALSGKAPSFRLDAAFEISRSLSHGHVAAVLGTLRRLELDALIDPKASRMRELVVAMIVSQVIAPNSKLAIARSLHAQTSICSLGEILGLSTCDVDDCYQAMDWVGKRQETIEDALAKRHLSGESTLVLYDVSSAAFEGKTCPLGALGHPKDGVHGRLQIVYGLLTAKDGTPIAIEVFPGNTADPNTVASQVKKLKERFGLSHVCLVGDRGMLTKARLRNDVVPAGLDYLSALRAPEIKNLINGGAIQLGLFDETDLFEIIHPDFPGERLVACKNPLLAAKRAKKRESLLLATKAELDRVIMAIQRERRPLRGKDKIALRVGKVINRYKMAKHFDLVITDDSLTYSPRQDRIAAEAALDGIYILRTSVPEAELSTDQVVSSYKALAGVERAFRAFNTDLDIRPIRHRTAERVRAHVFLRMLSYYVSLHMERSLAPMLYRDDDRQSAEAQRTSPVAPARRSSKATAKASTKRTEEDLPALSFQSLLANLATIVANQIQPKGSNTHGFTMITTPTKLQSRAFELLGVSHRLGYL